MSDFIRVEKGGSVKRNISLKNIEPVQNIKVIRDASSDDSSDDSSLSSYSSSESDISIQKPKKTKKVLRRKEAPVNYSAFSNPKKVSNQVDDDDLQSEYSDVQSSQGDDDQDDAQKSGEQSFEDKQRLKQDLLIKIHALEKKGFEFSKKFTITSNFDEMLFEFEKVKKYIETQATIKFSRRCLMACVTGIEFLNKKFDPFNVKIDGWSENVMENVDDYDNIFERLHEKYSSKSEISPEIELLLTLGGSAFMFHLTNTLLKAPVQSMNPIAQNSPNFMATMMSAMNQGMKESARPPFQQQPQQPMQQGFPQPMRTRDIRQEMQGPTIDPNLFNGTPLAARYPPPMVPQAPPQPPPPQRMMQRQPMYESNVNDDDDRFSIASSDSSLSSVSTTYSVKKVAVKGKKKGGFELNIS